MAHEANLAVNVPLNKVHRQLLRDHRLHKIHDSFIWIQLNYLQFHVNDKSVRRLCVVLTHLFHMRPLQQLIEHVAYSIENTLYTGSPTIVFI